MRFLKYKEDLRSLSFLTFAFGNLVASLFLAPEKHLLWCLPLIAWGTLMVFWITLLNHNHRHHPMFYNSILNRLTDVVISLCIGAPSTRLHVIHHFNHHRFYDSEKDWSNYRTHARGTGLRRIFHYVTSASREISNHRQDIRVPEALKNNIWLERVFIWLFAAIALWINPFVFLLVILPSWILGLLLLFISNLFNHDGCELESRTHHSRNFLNAVENWFFMNNGYHSAHHAKPHFHWTLLRQYHLENFENKLPKDLKRGSFFAYFFNYVVSGQGDHE